MRRAFHCLAILALTLSFAPVGAASDIDYSRASSWLARPGLDSAASLVPKDSGYSNLAASARADVFYVHPTTGMRKDVANVPIDDPQALATGRIMLMSQATPFNGIARIYAPRYRQIALHVFDEDEAALQAPIDFAYADVRRAFAYYAAHENQGRPFFLVAHSQGSNHALRLLIEEIQGTPLEARLVAAYLPGMPTPRAVFAGPLARIPPCAAAAQIGCVAIWGVFAEDYRDFAGWEASNVYWDAVTRRWRSPKGMPLVNVNPVSWREDDARRRPRCIKARYHSALPRRISRGQWRTWSAPAPGAAIRWCRLRCPPTCSMVAASLTKATIMSSISTCSGRTFAPTPASASPPSSQSASRQDIRSLKAR